MRSIMNTARALAQSLSKLRDGLRLGEVCITLFPIVVVCVVWLTMLCGGRLTGAHWWGCLGGLFLWAGLRKRYGLIARLQALGWFVLLLAGI